MLSFASSRAQERPHPLSLALSLSLQPWSSLVEGGEGQIVKQIWLLPFIHCIYFFVS